MISFHPQSLRRLWQDRSGAVLVYVTMGLAVFIGFSALAIDGSYLYLMSNRAQSAADAAALAGASQLPDIAAAEATAIEYAEKNLSVDRFGNVLASSDVTFGHWDPDAHLFAQGIEPFDAIQVVVRMSDDNANPVQLFFANALGFSEARVEAAAIAIGNPTGGAAPACIHALNPSAQRAFRKTGTSDVIGDGCNVQVDSCHATEAFNATGSGSVILAGENGSGTLSVCGGMRLTGATEIPPAPYSQENTGTSLGDPYDRAPYDAMPAPDEYGGCNYNDFNGSGRATLHPGIYCGGIRFTGTGTTNFAPGTYYIKDGALRVSGSYTLTGSGITFVMTGSNAVIDFSGSSKFSFSAPTTGPYAGFVVFGDPLRPSSSVHNITGSSTETFQGIVYLPNAGLKVTGTTGTALPSTGAHDCSVLVADTIEMTGTSSITVGATCTDYVATPPFQNGPLALRLVD